VKRTAIERVGGFNPRMGRTAGTLMGQEQREWFLRAHAVGVVGYYAPDVTVRHWIPRDRLTKRYFRRWFYWRGIGRAMLYAQTGKDMESPEQSQLDFAQVKHVFGIPRYLFRNALVAVRDVVLATLRRDRVNAFERELWLWMFAGIVRQRLKDRKQPDAVAAPARRASRVPDGHRRRRERLRHGPQRMDRRDGGLVAARRRGPLRGGGPGQGAGAPRRPGRLARHRCPVQPPRRPTPSCAGRR